MKNKESNIIFADHYSEKVRDSQEELYHEIERIMNSEIDKFIRETGRKPLLLDVGSAGLILYNTDKIDKITVLDLFPRPDDAEVIDNSEWIIGSILADDIYKLLPNRSYDIIIMSSLLHHLCNAKNKIISNLEVCFANSKAVLRKDGRILIFESTCPNFLAKLQDILYPVYSVFLINILRFTYVRMLALREIMTALKKNHFFVDLLYFKPPKYITSVFKKVPLKVTTLKIHAIAASLKEMNT